MSAPELPERKRTRVKRDVQNARPIKAAVAFQELQQNTALFSSKLGAQQELINKCLQDEPLFQQAAAENPDLAQLLQPDKMKELFAALHSTDELQKFFDAHPQLSDLTKHRQSVMQLKQQLQTLRQKQVRGLVPNRSQETMQAAKQILSQLMNTRPDMTVSQLQSKWPQQFAGAPPHANHGPPIYNHSVSTHNHAYSIVNHSYSSHNQSHTSHGHPHSSQDHSLSSHNHSHSTHEHPQAQHSSDTLSHSSNPTFNYSLDPSPRLPSTPSLDHLLNPLAHPPNPYLYHPSNLPAHQPSHPPPFPSNPTPYASNPSLHHALHPSAPAGALPQVYPLYPLLHQAVNSQSTQDQHGRHNHLHSQAVLNAHGTRSPMQNDYSLGKLDRIPDKYSERDIDQGNGRGIVTGIDRGNDRGSNGGVDRGIDVGDLHDRLRDDRGDKHGVGSGTSGDDKKDKDRPLLGGSSWQCSDAVGSTTGQSGSSTGQYGSTTGQYGSTTELLSVGGNAYDPGSVGVYGGGPPAKLHPKYYYEPVEPSNWTPPPADHCVRLYSRAYFWPMDVLFPPLWCCLGALLCGLKLLPVWLMLLLLPLSFILGLELLVVQGAGIPRKQLGLSKTVPSFVVSLEVVLLLVSAFRVSPLLLFGGTWLALQAGLLILLVSTGMILHWKAATMDPGYVELPTEEVSSADGDGRSSPVEGGIPGMMMAQCWTCRTPRPLRSKHCPKCQRCVLRFDHHCNMLPNCVGAGNQRVFVAFIFFALLSLVFFLKLSWQYLWLRFSGLADSTYGTYGTFVFVLQSASSATPELVLLQFTFIPLAAMIAFLAVRCVFLMAGNLTTNELLNRKRYSYLNHEVAGFCNRFDWGPWKNCVQFWGPQRDLEWWREFGIGDQAMRDQSMTMITTWSVTYYIRLWDVKYRQVQERLQKRRQERQDRRLQHAMRRLQESMD